MNEQTKTAKGETFWICLWIQCRCKAGLLAVLALVAALGVGCALHFGRAPGYQSTMTWLVVSQDAETTAEARIRIAEEKAWALSEILKTEVVLGRIQQEAPELGDFTGTFSAEPVEKCGYLLLIIRDAEEHQVQMAADAMEKCFPEIFRDVSQGFSLELLGDTGVFREGRKGISPWQGSSLAALAVGIFGLFFFCRKAMEENRLLSPADAREQLRLPIVAELPWEKKKRLNRRYPVSDDYCEQIGRLCRRIEDAEGAKVFLITSVDRCQGKTTVAFQLAGAMAMKGKRTALVELDLRNPGLRKYLRREPKRLVNELLLKPLEMPALENAMMHKGNLYILFGGQTKRRAEQLLQGAGLETLLTQLRAFDCVIVDTAPVGKYPDAQKILPFCDGAFLMAEMGISSAQDVQNSAGLLQWEHCPFLGCVLNGVSCWDWKNGGERKQ